MIPIVDLPKTDHELRDLGWTKIGAGISREAYVHNDRPGVVAKFTYGIHNNQKECETWEAHCEDALSFMLVPILGRNENYSCILMKRMPHVFEFNYNDPFIRALSEITDREGKSRKALQIWRDENRNTYDDFHMANWNFMSDDYGYFTPGQILDYAT